MVLSVELTTAARVASIRPNEMRMRRFAVYRTENR
jgi:hypothetical protein